MEEPAWPLTVAKVVVRLATAAATAASAAEEPEEPEDGWTSEALEEALEADWWWGLW